MRHSTVDTQSLCIGPSTGWLSAKLTPNLLVHEEILLTSGANAVEMVWFDEPRRAAMLEGKFARNLFQYISLHLGSFEDFDHSLSDEQASILSDLRTLSVDYALDCATIHPDTTPLHLYQLLLDSGLQIAVENMDRRRKIGKTIEEIEQFMIHAKRPAVLDLQHCYEVALDNQISFETFTKHFAETMLRHGGISHLHVSGEITVDGIQRVAHAQLTDATNCASILAGLRAVLELCPDRKPALILEGDPLLNFDFISSSEPLSEHEFARRRSQATQAIAAEIDFVILELSSTKLWPSTARTLRRKVA